MSELHQQLSDKIRQLEQIRKIKSHIGELRGRLQVEEESLAAMEKVLDKEQRDVEILEQEGLTTMLRKFLGDREEKLEKEREEYLRASLRFNELFKSVELIRFELDLLTRKERSVEAVQGEVELLMKARETEMLQGNDENARALTAIHLQTDKLSKYSVQIDEALAAGQAAMQFVRRAMDHLADAQQWGQRGMWGGQRGAGHMKWRSIDEARKMVVEGRHALIRFGNELKDVDDSLRVSTNLDIETFGKFGETFFDNIITDWIVQQKINKSLHAVDQMRIQVENILMHLQSVTSEIKASLQGLEKRRREIVIGGRE
jgi:hypothetical protein